MSEARVKRFYTDVTLLTTPEATGYVLHLDGRQARTKGRHVLQVPFVPLGEALAAEWRAQGTEIHLDKMPLTGLVSVVLDRFQDPHAQAAVRADMLNYAASDLLCYRAEGPASLAQRQEQRWDPILTWVAQRYGAVFSVSTGIMPIEQSAESLEKIRQALAEIPAPWHIAGVHMLTQMLGSLFLALALHERQIMFDTAWAAAHVDEHYQAGIWGEDEEARQRRDARRRDTEQAMGYTRLLG